ncbi:MAG: hypothetical protein NC489_39745 [Ruminococcus flavefaciens]|nr:hypothetical protein [Ruminococcus flavefaciens]
MEVMETAKTVLSAMLETAGEAVGELSKHGIGFTVTLDSLESVYKEIGAERQAGAVICYRKGKPKPEKKEESMAVRIAKKLGQRNIGEKHYNDIINCYRR